MHLPLEKKRKINDDDKENVSTYITDRNTSCNEHGRIILVLLNSDGSEDGPRRRLAMSE